MIDLLNTISEKQKRVQSHRPLPKELVANLDEWFKIELTYTSNAIEGNTLSRQETALVIEKGLTVAGKSLTEHLEAINHAEAFLFLKSLLQKKNRLINEKDILDIHHLILQKIDDRNAGRYRNVPVRIAGSQVILPNAMKIPELMKQFTQWLQGDTPKTHPAIIAADAHFKLVSIHPFVDGNGRTARLLMNLILMRAGYPPALIRKEDRLKYLNAIEKGQLFGSTDDYDQLIFKAIDRSLDIYLKALEQKESGNTKSPSSPLLKIGELSKKSGENIPTIRYWTNEGLLKVSQFTNGGYQLYSEDTIEQIKKIRQLQKEKRWTIREIKGALEEALDGLDRVLSRIDTKKIPSLKKQLGR